jgi:virulence factor Mce-like protein
MRSFGRPVGQQRGRAFMASVGILGILLAGVTFYIGYEAANSVPGRGYYNIKAEFEDANNLANHYEVRMGGVRAGQILKPRVENGKAVVDLRLDDKFKPLPVDSQLQVRLRSAVGVRYLEIIPGKSSQMLEENDTIASSQVLESVALDEVLGTFDGETRGRTQALLRELGNSFDGRGPDLNDAIGATPDLLENLSGVSKAITSRPGEQMSRFIRNGSRVADAFDKAKDDIVAGFDPQERALRSFTEARDGVQGTLSEGAPTLGALRSDLPNVSRLLREVGGLASEARPAFAVAPASLRETTKLLRGAEQPLDDLEDTLDLADRAVSPVLDLLGKVRPVLPTLDTTLEALFPQLTNLGPRACEISNAAIGWAHYLGIGSNETNFIRFHLLAVRPEQTVGQGKGSDELNNLYDQFVNVDPYYGPCTNQGTEGATGKQRPVTARIVNAGKRPFNRTDNLPYETDPNIVAGPEQFIQGGK